MSQEQQEEIKLILSNNQFVRRNRPGRGPAFTQGLLRCAVCGILLSVNYHKNKSYSYGCGWDTEPCTRFISYEFDQYILAEVFKVLETPPLAMLKAALQESQSQERARLGWIESERERLQHEERRARERADLTHGGLRRVHRDALEKLEKVLEEKEEFERKIAWNKRVRKPMNQRTKRGGALPARERSTLSMASSGRDASGTKEILRCLIDHVVVAATKEKIDATIFWKSGQPDIVTDLAGCWAL